MENVNREMKALLTHKKSIDLHHLSRTSAHIGFISSSLSLSSPSLPSMAPTVSQIPQASLAPFAHPPRLTCVKTLAQSPELTSIPSNYNFSQDDRHEQIADSDSEVSIPIIDFSLLSGTHEQRSKVIHDLGKACQEWGFFTVVNHGLPESLMNGMMSSCKEFFDLTDEEKREFEAKHVLDPIRYGTSFNPSVEKVFFWRDFIKVFVHPEFHSLNKPAGFSDLSREYCRRTREVVRELLRGISESMGLEPCYIEKALNMEKSLQILAANLYPPCPQPDLAMGMPPHSDHGLLILLSQNGIGGLQLQHNGRWVNVDAIPNSFMVNTGDHLEILSNGKYKSVVHRAVVNGNATRISLVIGNGPSLETVVSPAPELIGREGNAAAAYTAMKYRDYLELQQSNKLETKSCLDRVRVFKN